MKKILTAEKSVPKSVIDSCKVIENKPLNEEIRKIIFECPEISKNALPGQFVSVLCDDLTLRRPFSIASCKGDVIEIIYKIKGKGTKFIASLRNNDKIDIMGPLGKGFSITKEKALLVGGGVGTAPLVFLSEILKEKNIEHSLIQGYRSETQMGKIFADRVYTITEDGSSGKRGLIKDYLEEIITREKPKIIYACGPDIVLKNIVETAKKHNIKTQIALEREFACGVGVCMGCSIKIKQNGSTVNKRICKDGPVFDGESIIWN